MPFDAADFPIAQPAEPVTKTALQDFRDRLAMIDPRLFDMSNPAPSCGTPVCFCGWAKTFYFCGRDAALEDVSARLGLSHSQAADLFMMGASDRQITRAIVAGVSPFAATLTDGLRVLDHFIASGEVDWSVVRAKA